MTAGNVRRQAIYAELLAILSRHRDSDPVELLAIASNVVGKVLAMQDQRTMTKDRALDIVMKNIEIGNADVLEHLQNTRGSA